MTITYTWKVTGVKTKTEDGNQDAVVQTYWTKTGTDENGNTGTFSGATPFTSLNMPAGSTFVPFAELTETIVLSWIQAIVTGGYEEHVNAQIAKQIADKIMPVSEPALPWAPPPPVPVAPNT
jgi:hypothetical protein